MTRIPAPIVRTTAVLATAVILAIWALPPKARILRAPAWTSIPLSVPGAYHIHTVLSDGSGTIGDVAAAAAGEGLRFVIVTDHGDGTRILPPAYHSGVLCIDAVEISTTGGHYVALGLTPTPYPLGGEPRDVVADVTRLGGFGVVAHPDSPEPGLRWSVWDVPFDGIEWMNADSERRRREPWQLAAAVIPYLFRPDEVLVSLFRRPTESLSRWDALADARRVVGLAGADAHARIGWGGTERQGGRTIARLPSYEASFGAFSIHAEIVRPLTGDAAEDARIVLDAIEAGHVYTSLDGLAHPAAFMFTARSGAHEAGEGDDLLLDGPLSLRARINDPRATLVLVRDGVPIAEAAGGDATFHLSAVPAVFRIEAHRPEQPRAAPLPWIVSNPIYVRATPRSAMPPPPLVAEETRLVIPQGAWSMERSPGSTATLTMSAPMTTASDSGVRLDFTLGGGVPVGQYVAAVHDMPANVGSFGRLVFRARASRPLRMSIQLRDTTGRRWLRSVYVAPVAQDITVAFTDLHAAVVMSMQGPNLDRVRTILFGVDLTNASPGASGRIWLSDLRLAR